MKTKRTENRYRNKWIARALVALAVMFVFTACQAESDPDGSLPANGSDIVTEADASSATLLGSSDNGTTAEATESETTAVSTQTTMLPITTTQAATLPQSTTTTKSFIPTTTKAIIPTTTARVTAQSVTTTRKKVTTTAATPTTTLPPFDINYWVQFAKDYAVSIGLELSKGTMGTWDNPLAAGPTLKNTERDIKSSLDWYKREGYTSVWVWAEKRPNSEKFDLYISKG